MNSSSLIHLKQRLLPFFYVKNSSYSWSFFVKDLVAAPVVAVVLIPQSVGNATLAGLAPQAGMYAALLAVAIAAMWGSSHSFSSCERLCRHVLLNFRTIKNSMVFMRSIRLR